MKKTIILLLLILSGISMAYAILAIYERINETPPKYYKVYIYTDKDTGNTEEWPENFGIIVDENLKWKPK